MATLVIKNRELLSVKTVNVRRSARTILQAAYLAFPIRKGKIHHICGITLSLDPDYFEFIVRLNDD